MDLQNVENLTLNDSDEMFGIFYDLVITLTNGEIIELHSVKGNLDIRNAELWSINNTYFICKGKSCNDKDFSMLGIPFYYFQSYFDIRLNTVVQFLENYYDLRNYFLSLPYSDFSTDLVFHREKEGWGIDENGIEYFIGRYSTEFHYLSIPDV